MFDLVSCVRYQRFVLLCMIACSTVVWVGYFGGKPSISNASPGIPGDRIGEG